MPGRAWDDDTVYRYTAALAEWPVYSAGQTLYDQSWFAYIGNRVWQFTARKVPSASHRDEGLFSGRRPRQEAAGSAVRWRLLSGVVQDGDGRGCGSVQEG